MARGRYETTDLYEQKPEVVKAITDLLDGFKQSGRSRQTAGTETNRKPQHGEE